MPSEAVNLKNRRELARFLLIELNGGCHHCYEVLEKMKVCKAMGTTHITFANNIHRMSFRDQELLKLEFYIWRKLNEDKYSEDIRNGKVEP